VYANLETKKHCPLCGGPSQKSLVIGRGHCQLQSCEDCAADFADHVEPSSKESHGDHFQGLNLRLYEQSVQRTREKSYDQLLNRVKRHLKGGSWLDVGCSYGWLLKRVQKEGFTGYGVEPSASAATQARQDGLAVAQGIFPAETGESVPYSVVSFMDVLEHLPNPAEVLLKTKALMTPEGLLIVQVPDQQCLLYKTAKVLARAGGVDFALQRLWLVGFPFPHRFYFNKSSLYGLMHKAGFEVVEFYRAPIGSPGEAFSRVEYVERNSGPLSIVVAAGVAALQVIDNLSRHGGLMVLIARQRRIR